MGGDPAVSRYCRWLPSFTSTVMAQSSHQEKEPNRGPKQDTKKTGKVGAHTIPAQMI